MGLIAYFRSIEWYEVITLLTQWKRQENRYRPIRGRARCNRSCREELKQNSFSETDFNCWQVVDSTRTFSRSWHETARIKGTTRCWMRCRLRVRSNFLTGGGAKYRLFFAPKKPRVGLCWYQQSTTFEQSQSAAPSRAYIYNQIYDLHVRSTVMSKRFVASEHVCNCWRHKSCL